MLAGPLLSGCNCSQSFEARITRIPALERFKPALAVRGLGCTVCHANIQSNVVTDFGYGDPWFLGNNTAGISAPFYGNPSGMENGQWQPAWQSIDRLEGQVIIPDVLLTPAEHAPILKSVGMDQGVPHTLASVLSKTPYSSTALNDSYGPLGNPAAGNTVATVNPAVSGLNTPMIPAGKLLVKKRVVIRTPSNADFSRMGLASGGRAVLTGGRTITAVANGSDPPSFGGDYLYLTGDIHCTGSHALNVPVVLHNVTLHSDSEGCTLYVSRSVFISGSIRYSGATPGEHLKISTPRGVYAGIDRTAIQRRFFAHAFSPPPETGRDNRFTPYRADSLFFQVGFVRSFPQIDPPAGRTRADGAYYTVGRWSLAEPFAFELLQDFGPIYGLVSGQPQGPILEDACTGTWPAALDCSTRKQVDFSHLLINAREVHWGYRGTLEGVVISELYVGAGGSINFKFDPLFAQPGFKAFPELERAIGAPMLEIFD